MPELTGALESIASPRFHNQRYSKAKAIKLNSTPKRIKNASNTKNLAPSEPDTSVI